MSEEKAISVTDLSGLSKPATVLIKKISGAVGKVYEPTHVKRMAKANAAAAMIDVQSEGLRRRALERLIQEEERKQENMESVAAKSIPLLNEDADPEAMEDDWVSHFFEKMRNTSNESMQDVWARILAGEANAPGTFDKRTVNIMGDMSSQDAKMFVDLCRFSWLVGQDPVPLIFSTSDEIYVKNSLGFREIMHLESLDLVRLEGLANFSITLQPRDNSVDVPLKICYFGDELLIDVSKLQDRTLNCGKVLFTRSGLQLREICEASPVDGFYDYVASRWASIQAD